MKRLLFLLPLLFGCMVFAQDDNMFSVGFETKLVFTQVGPKDTDARAEFGLDAPEWMRKSVVDWIYSNQQTPNEETVEELTTDEPAPT